ncbi:MAG: GGDEF domain-containing protein, partial [Micromonosporaceae bacterium]|nr:GGDEF domain-containing protein [Micromonosporaceae bacterium]
MGILHPAVRIASGAYTRRQADELARLGAEVARLEAERAALSWAAGHDDLTGLPNRRLLAALAVPRIQATGAPAVVLVLDLDGFKPVNDGYGHHAGDLVLREIALRIATWAGANPAARIGGDEFAAVLTGPSGAPTGPNGHAGRSGGIAAWTGRYWWEPGVAALCATVARPVRVGGVTVTLTASVGVASADGATSFPDLLNRADVAMYRAKASRRRYAVWSADDESDARGQAVNAAAAPGAGQSSIELSVFAAGSQPAAGPQPATGQPAGSPPGAGRQPAAGRQSAP